MVQILLEHGADANAVDSVGLTPMDIAVKALSYFFFSMKCVSVWGFVFCLLIAYESIFEWKYYDDWTGAEHLGEKDAGKQRSRAATGPGAKGQRELLAFAGESVKCLLPIMKWFK